MNLQKPTAMRTKTRKADLEGQKTLFFQVGLVVALSAALLAFEWPTQGDIDFTMIQEKFCEIPEEVIPITTPERIIPPRPPSFFVPEVINIRPDNELIDDEGKDIFNEFEEVFIPYLFEPKAEEEIEEALPFMLVEEKPTFMGGDYNTFSRWVFKKLIYPEIPAQNGIQGRVTLEFMIDVDGSVRNIRVIQSVDPMLDAEAVRVVLMSPKWTPGLQRGKPVRVIFTFPVIFKLN